MARPWMPFYIADYLADTGHLSTIEHGAYMLLIMHYWQAGGLPDSDQKLSRICRMSEAEWASVRDTLSDFFDEDWRHKRIDAEIATADELLAKRKAAGAAGASARYGKRIANAEQTDSIARGNSPSQPPSPEETEKKDSAASAPADLDPRSMLFSQGLKELASISGRPEGKLRSMVGRWLRHSDDDALHVLGLISKAKRDRPAEPIAWIEKHFRERQTGPPTNGHAKPIPAQEAINALERLKSTYRPETSGNPGEDTGAGPTIETSFHRRTG